MTQIGVLSQAAALQNCFHLLGSFFVLLITVLPRSTPQKGQRVWRFSFHGKQSQTLDSVRTRIPKQLASCASSAVSRTSFS